MFLEEKWTGTMGLPQDSEPPGQEKLNELVSAGKTGSFCPWKGEILGLEGP